MTTKERHLHSKLYSSVTSKCIFCTFLSCSTALHHKTHSPSLYIFPINCNKTVSHPRSQYNASSFPLFQLCCSACASKVTLWQSKSELNLFSTGSVYALVKNHLSPDTLKKHISKYNLVKLLVCWPPRCKFALNYTQLYSNK